MPIEPTKFVLLTGAGFSKNFGGWTSNELREKIISLLLSEKLKKVFLDNPDYEDAYTSAMESPLSLFTENEKQTIQYAVIQSYAELCNNMKEMRPRENEIFSRFIKPVISFQGTERPFFFTLNQDLFLEYKHGWFSPQAPRHRHDLESIRAGIKDFRDLNFEKIRDTIPPTINYANIINDIEDHAWPCVH